MSGTGSQHTDETDSTEETDRIGDSETGAETGPTTNRRRFVQGLSATVAGGMAATGLASVSKPTSAAGGESVALQYFHTDWTTIESNMDAVANAGYSAMWVPAPQKSKLTEEDQDANNHPPLGYQPVNHRSFDSEFGTEAELSAMIDTAHNKGIDVYVDCVLNHMAAGMGYDFPYFSEQDFHSYGPIDDYSDDYAVEHGDLLGLKDLAQDDSQYVRDQLKRYMEKIAATGADGFRFDAVKHVPESFWRDYANQWAEDLGMFRVGEVLNSSLSYVQGYVNTGMTAFDYPLYYTLKDAFTYGGDLSILSGSGLKAQDPLNAVTFVQNHDVDGPDNWYLAHAYVLTSEGYPMLYKTPLDDDAINNLIWIKNNLAGGATYDRYTSQNVYVYERYNNLLVGLNQSDSWTTKRVYTSWGNTTLNDYTGSIGDVTTNGSGYVDVSIPPMGWVCLAPY